MNSAPTAVEFRGATLLGGKPSTGSEDPLERAPRVVAIPPDLVDALAGDGEAGWAFADLTSSEQRRLVRTIAAAGSHETRRRRIAQTVATLRAERA